MLRQEVSVQQVTELRRGLGREGEAQDIPSQDQVICSAETKFAHHQASQCWGGGPPRLQSDLRLGVSEGRWCTAWPHPARRASWPTLGIRQRLYKEPSSSWGQSASNASQQQ